MSNLFKLNVGDLGRGAVTALLAGVVWSVASVFTQSGFDIFSADWKTIINSALNAGMAAFVGYLSKNLLTDSEGKLLGKF